MHKTISAGGLAIALSLGGLALGVTGCASNQAASKSSDTAMKGGEKSCGEGSCSGEKAATTKGEEKSCGATSSADKDKGGEKSCGEGSCG